MSLQAIKTEISNNLNSISSINEVYDYHNLWGKSPYITFEWASLNAEVFDTKHNSRIWNFQVVVIQEMQNISRDKATWILNKVVQDIVDKLDQNFTLNGEANWWVTPISWEKTQVQIENSDVLVADLTVQAKELNQFT